MKRFILFLILSLGMIFPGINVFGQDALVSQFFAVPVYLNPAFAGSHKGINAVLGFRTHPFVDINNTSGFNGSVDAFVPSINSGIGILGSSSYQGNLIWTNSINVLYSYHLKVAEELYVNFGAQAGYRRTDFKWANLDFSDNSQPVPEQLWRGSSDFASGVLLYHKSAYAGFSVHHLTQPNQSLFGDAPLDMKYTAHAGMFIEPTERRRANTLPFYYFISPNIIYQKQGPFHRINLGMYLGVENLMAGMWYRHDLENSGTLIFLLGMVFNQYRLGYSYDYSLSGFTDQFHGIHEITLSWSLEYPGEHPSMKCPRF